MTLTTDTTSNTDNTTGPDSPDSPDDAVAVASDAEFGEYMAVDPAELLVGPNIRTDAKLGRDYVADIREHGVGAPIITQRDPDDGRLVVLEGSRRTLAAIKVGLPRVPVIVLPGSPNEGDPATKTERIIRQIRENEHREPNTDHEIVGAHQQLLDLGLNAAQIARRTKVPAKRVQMTTTVAASELATKAMDRFKLSLDHALVLAEFDDGTERGIEYVKRLTVIAQTQPDQFDHAAQRCRDELAEAKLEEAAEAELTAAGVRVLAEPDEVPAAVPLTSLRARAEDPVGTELHPDDHAQCPGHAAYVLVRRDFRDDTMKPVTHYVCTDPDRHGHIGRYMHTSAPATISGASTDTASSNGADPGADTHTGPAADHPGSAYARPPLRGTQHGGEMSEEEKARRRLVIANNKKWASAEIVRRGWLREFFHRKTMPKNAAAVVALAMTAHNYHLRKAMETGNRTACTLLGLDKPPVPYSGRPHPLAEAARAATTGPQAIRLALAVVLGAFEENTGTHSWRNPIASDMRFYFQTLADLGYSLSEVEQLITADEQPDDEPQDEPEDEPEDEPDDLDGDDLDGDDLDGDDLDGDDLDGDDLADDLSDRGRDSGEVGPGSAEVD